MKAADVLANAFAMPLTSPAYPKGPYRFFDRTYFTITYRTDPEALEAVVPEPLKVIEPVVKYEFMTMPDSTGFGDYTESGQVIPVEFEGRKGSYTHAMFLNDEAPIAGGREIWGFPKKLADPKVEVLKDALVGTLDVNGLRVATATMGYKYETLDAAEVAKGMDAPGWLLKIIPRADGTGPQICELVEFRLEDLNVKGAWAGPAGLEFYHHALAPLTDLPIREILGATMVRTDLTLGMGKVVHDYLA
ncbi:MAG: acetoacetate decarboxylase [Rhodobacteraceae bacterium]|nr:acetoacetate decarboxylase [Paracoccaceae bacterium]QEW24093.1 putative acetoacetate decarboxylase [Paracoccaceae bacterium]